MICDKCKKDKNLRPMVDFHGNCIGLFCKSCQQHVEDLLERIFYKCGGYRIDGATVASPKGSPHLKSLEDVEIFLSH